MANSHDEQRFRSLYDGHHGAVLGYFYRRIEPNEAFDATEDVFLVAWRRLADVPDGEDALAWLYTVAHHVLSNHERSHRRSSRLIAKLAHAPIEPPPGPETAVIRRREDQSVLDALSTLRPQDQELLRLAYWDELPHADIGRLIGCSRRTADVRIHRAMSRLRKAFMHAGHRGAERRTALTEESQTW